MKPEKILSHAPRLLRQAEREAYFENGYLLLESFIQGELLARLQATVAEFVEKSRAVEVSDEMFDVEPGHSSEAPRLRRLNGPVEHHPLFWAAAFLRAQGGRSGGASVRVVRRPRAYGLR